MSTTKFLQFRGLILFQCPECDRVQTIYSSDVMENITCKCCNKTTHLHPFAAGVRCKCECGRFIKAVTNSISNMLEFNCKCGYPLTVEYNRTKDLYVGCDK